MAEFRHFTKRARLLKPLFYISVSTGADGERLGAMEIHARLHGFRNGMRVEPHLRRTPHGLSSIRSAWMKQKKTKQTKQAELNSSDMKEGQLGMIHEADDELHGLAGITTLWQEICIPLMVWALWMDEPL